MGIAIITGASSGLGAEFAKQIDDKNFDEIWLIARRQERLMKLASRLHTNTKILKIDVTQQDMLLQFKELLKNEQPQIDLLINCAGYGLLGNIKNLKLKEQLGMIYTNCCGLTSITYYCIPYMSKNSHMIQLASSAAFLPQPHFAIYAATKAYVYHFSLALREELRKENISVTTVCPGYINTEFISIAEKYEKNLEIKKLTASSAVKVVHKALKDTYHKKTLSIYGIPMKCFHVITKILPVEWLLSITRILR